MLLMIFSNQFYPVQIVTLLLFYVLISCHNNNPVQKKNTSLSIEPLTGEVFIVAPGMDSIKCLAYGECDCCAGHYFFITDTEFIAVEYCLESDTYFKGSYSYDNNQVIFSADGHFVNKEYAMEEIDSSIHVSEPQLKSNKGKSSKFRWTRFECKNSTSFITVESDTRFVTVDSEEEFEELIQAIKNEGIWAALGMD